LLTEEGGRIRGVKLEEEGKGLLASAGRKKKKKILGGSTSFKKGPERKRPQQRSITLERRGKKS